MPADQQPVVEVDDTALDTLQPGSIIALARSAGVLLVEEEQFPELVRVRLKRNRAE